MRFISPAFAACCARRSMLQPTYHCIFWTMVKGEAGAGDGESQGSGGSDEEGSTDGQRSRGGGSTAA